MDAFRRAKSSDRMDVSEISSWADYSGKTTPTLLHELTSDTPSKKTSRPESPIVDDDLEDDVQIKEFQPESAESSSENVSQYLDKEEVPPKPLGLKPEETTLTSEPADRKRKLSTESGHSFLKRIQEAKRKIKVPKISFSTKKCNKKLGSPSKDPNQKRFKKQIEKTPLHKTDEKPHYIYIPLKPPPGQTDEFSYLEFASNENGVSKEQQSDKSGKSSEVCEDNLSDIKNGDSVQGSSETHDEKEARLQLAKEEPTKSEKSNVQQDTFEYIEKETRDSEPTATKGSQEGRKKSPVKINPAFKQFLKKVRHLKNSDQTETVLKDNVAEERNNSSEELDTSGILKVSKVEEKGLNGSTSEQNDSDCKQLKLSTRNESETVEISDSGLDLDEKMHVGQVLTDGKEEVEAVKAFDDTNTVPEDSHFPEITEDDFDRLFETSSKKDPKHWELTVPAGSSGNVEEITRKTRSKSAEPEKKRKLSLESRKSLSRLGLMKKIREVSGKLTNALSVENFKQLFKSNESQKQNTNAKKDDGSVKKEAKVKVDEKHKRTRSTPVEPVYIRIPLKPPEGKTDEFSYLEDSAGEPTVNKEAKERSDSLDTTSPNEIKSKDIQFIFLTPPSDDELLDKDSDVPETPSLDEVVGFGPLKKLAQDVVDQVSPDTKKNILEPVCDVSENHSEEPDRSQHNIDIDHPSNEENMIVDVEDGLNEAAKTDDNRKSALKSNEPTYQKRVSFKRKCRASKEPVKENEYEVIQAPSEETAANPEKTDQDENTDESLQVCETIQLMSVSGENTNLPLDTVEDVHLEEEEFKRCSKVTGDHEYEPISAPDELTVLPTVLDDDDPKLVISAAEILDRPIEDKKRSFFQFGRFRKDSTQTTNDRNLDTESSSDIPERESQDLKKSKFLMQLNRFRKGPVQEDKLTQVNQPEQHRFGPHIRKPKFGKIDFKRFKPNINLHLPQLPDTATIRFPHINLPGAKKTTETRTVESRQFSTESNADDTEHQPKRHRFDLNFRATFPRLAKKKKSSSNAEVIFATAPRVKKNDKKKLDDNMRIPLHSEDSIGTADTRDLEEETDRQSGQARYEEGLEMSAGDDNLLNRWKHGSFRERPQAVDSEERIIGQLVEQRFGVIGQGYRSEALDDRLRKLEEKSRYTGDDLDDDKEEEFVLESRLNNQLVTDLDNLDDDQLGGSKEGYSSEGSGSLGQKGRLGKLDIDSDEFFVVHEIREGFQTPSNALAQMNEYDPIGSNRCLQQISGLVEQKERRKPPIKKPKRKKTPHVSREEIQGDEESIDEMALPSRPKRRSEKAGNKMEEVEVVPYEETISLHGHRLDFPRESLGILGDDEGENDDINREPMQVQGNHSLNNRRPRVPTRRHRSLKSLDQSETESLLDTDSGILQEQRIQEAPTRPSRRSNSMLNDTEDLMKTQQENGNRECVEEPCIQDIRDYMGYAIVDKSKQREPPLPPPRTLPRRSKRDLASQHKFATLPGTQSQVPPVRPLRNYSTVSHVKSSPMYCPHGNKENEIDIGQYIESNTEEATRNLVSGEIVQKMQRRPLPAPPRPPRKSKTNRRSLQDITSQANICEETVSTQTEPLPPDFICEEISEEPTDKVIFPRIFESTPVSKTHSQQYQNLEKKPETLEPEKYSQKEKLHIADLHSQMQEILESGANKTCDNESKEAQKVESYNDSQLQKFHIYDPRSNQSQAIRKELITPSVYTFEETVTHGTLLVQPLNGAHVLSDHQPSRERVVPITRTDSMDDFEASEVPESFELLKSAKDQDLAMTEAQQLQVTDLDVDPLKSNQSLAHDISVPNNQMQRISGNINLEEPHKIPGGPDTTSANLEYQKYQLQAGDVPEIRDTYLSHVPPSSSIDVSNPLSSSDPEHLDLPDARPQYPETCRFVDDSSFHSTGNFLNQEQLQAPPVPPPRSSTLERGVRGSSLQGSIDPSEDVEESPQLVMLEPEIDDEAPPPRPPHPRYVPSQPPPAFYALRAQKYVDEHMPVTAPLRKRQQRCRPVSRSRSTSEEEVSSTNPRRSSKMSRRSSEASIPELSRRLIEACGSRINNTLKRLIFDLTQKFLRNSDGNQDLHVFMVILLVLIAGLILLGYGEERTVVHLHHWEYFNPPKDL